MLATTPDKALLRLVWEQVLREEGTGQVALASVAGRLHRLQNGAEDAVDPSFLDELEEDALALQQMGLLRVAGRNGSRSVTLTQVGALLARGFELPATTGT